MASSYTCIFCGERNLELHKAIEHEDNCAHRPRTSPAEPAPVASLSLHKFNTAKHPQGLDPRTAIEAAVAWLDAQPDKPQHIIVVIGRDFENGSSGTKYFQAGDYRHHSQMGLMMEGMHQIRESGHDQ